VHSPSCASSLQALHELLQGDMDIRKVLLLERFKNHSDHLSGRKSKATLIGEFADCIASDVVSWPQFQLYYRAIATSTLSNEGLFTQLVRSCTAMMQAQSREHSNAMVQTQSCAHGCGCTLAHLVLLEQNHRILD
jgi:hypothetical protein